MILLIITVYFCSGSILTRCQRNRNLKALLCIYLKKLSSQIAKKNDLTSPLLIVKIPSKIYFCDAIQCLLWTYNMAITISQPDQLSELPIQRHHIGYSVALFQCLHSPSNLFYHYSETEEGLHSSVKGNMYLFSESYCSPFSLLFLLLYTPLCVRSTSCNLNSAKTILQASLSSS